MKNKKSKFDKEGLFIWLAIILLAIGFVSASYRLTPVDITIDKSMPISWTTGLIESISRLDNEKNANRKNCVSCGCRPENQTL